MLPDPNHPVYIYTSCIHIYLLIAEMLYFLQVFMSTISHGLKKQLNKNSNIQNSGAEFGSLTLDYSGSSSSGPLGSSHLTCARVRAHAYHLAGAGPPSRAPPPAPHPSPVPVRLRTEETRRMCEQDAWISAGGKMTPESG